MMFMVVETFRKAIYCRLREKGRMMPSPFRIS